MQPFIHITTLITFGEAGGRKVSGGNIAAWTKIRKAPDSIFNLKFTWKICVLLTFFSVLFSPLYRAPSTPIRQDEPPADLRVLLHGVRAPPDHPADTVRHLRVGGRLRALGGQEVGGLRGAHGKDHHVHAHG